MQKGQIRVQTENIFPIIKKFLYSDHEIFLRELVSNAVDASQKLKTLASIGEAKGELGELRIDVALDVQEKTLTITDRGVGMSKEEVDKYLNQVAFSGAEEFLNKYKDANIIGHFGLGFYSAFMVSERVEVLTQSYNDEAASVYWSCDGSPEFELYEVEKRDRGTRIILHINDDSKEFLEGTKIKGILEKFCRFLPIPIYFTEAGEKEEGEQKSINNTNPIWTKKPSELTTEDYQNFYRELYPYGETPLFWIHLNVDYPFNLTGILYFPKIKQSYEIQKDKIQLYSNQVFVTDEVKDIVPEFLMLLHGVIDSPDIPLNVSRSYLQGDPNVKKINAHITKKVADKLDEIFRNDRPSFEEKWESLGLFVKYGMMTDDKFLDKANKFLVMQDAKDNKFYTLEEYKMATENLQKNKEGKQVILYTTDPVQQDAYIQASQQKGYVIAKMETMVDAAFINNMEMKWEGVHFVRVDADIVDNLIDKQEKNESVLSNDETEQLKQLFSFELPQLHATIEVKGLSTDTAPVVATRPEFMRRMKDMAAMGGGGMTAFYATMPDEVILTVNGNHPIYQTLLKENDATRKEKQVRTLADLALLSQGLLKGNDLTNFINRNVELMRSEGKESNILLNKINKREDVVIYIPDDDVSLLTEENIVNAAGEFMEAMGFELETEDEPVYGSFLKKMKFIWNQTLGKENAGKVYDEARKALELQQLGIPSADQTEKLANSAEKLVSALSSVKEGFARLGAIVVLKKEVDGEPKIIIQQLSNEMIILLDKNPKLICNLNTIYELLTGDVRVEKKLDDPSEIISVS